MFEEEVGELLTDNGKNGVVFEKCDIIRKNFKLNSHHKHIADFCNIRLDRVVCEAG